MRGWLRRPLHRVAPVKTGAQSHLALPSPFDFWTPTYVGVTQGGVGRECVTGDRESATLPVCAIGPFSLVSI